MTVKMSPAMQNQRKQITFFAVVSLPAGMTSSVTQTIHIITILAPYVTLAGTVLSEETCWAF